MSAAMGQGPDSPNAIGRVGQIALLRQVRPQLEGKLVAVCAPGAPRASPGDRQQATLSWQVLVLGHAVDVDGTSCRELVVADRSLQPIARVTPKQVELLIRRRAEQDFDEAAADVSRILEAHPMGADDLDALMDRAAEQALIQHLIEVVPPVAAFREMGFRPTGDARGSVWQWSVVCKGDELQIAAGPDMFGLWMVSAGHATARHVVFDERVLSDAEPRGKVILTVLDLWRSAYGREAPAPRSLQAALVYERHLREMGTLTLGPPTVLVDGKALRATRRWLSQRFSMDTSQAVPQAQTDLELSVQGGLLRLAVAETVFGCPAKGLWVDDCAISLQQFLAVPAWRLRGDVVVLVQGRNAITINGRSVAIRDRLVDARA